MNTHLDHLIVHSVENEAEELFSVFLSAFNREHVSPKRLQHLQDDCRLEGVVRRDIWHLILLALFSRNPLAERKQTVVGDELDPERVERKTLDD